MSSSNVERIIKAAKDGELEMVEHLLNEGAVNVDIRDDDGRTMLYWAALYGQVEIVQLLLEKGANPNLIDELSSAPIHLASYNGRFDIVKMLLDHGADPNRKGIHGKTALHYCRNTEVAEVLLEYGANTHAKNKDGGTALYCILCKNPVIARLILEKGGNGNTALHTLCINGGSPEAVRVLLQSGVDVNAKNKDGMTALHLSYKNPTITRLLLEGGAEINGTDDDGNTALHILCHCGGSPEVAKVLIEHSIDIHATNKYHFAAISYSLCQREVWEILVREILSSSTSLSITTTKKGWQGRYVKTFACLLNDNMFFITELNLGGNGIGAEGAKELAPALKKNTSLTHLHLGNNSIRDKGVNTLSTSLKENDTLTHLHLNKNRIGDEGAKILASVLKEKETLAFLDLSWNDIKDVGATELAKSLAVNDTLTDLNLAENDITAEGAVKIACALEENTALAKLNLDHNPIDENRAVEAFEFYLRKKNFTLLDLELPHKYNSKFNRFHLQLNKAGRSIMAAEGTTHSEKVERLAMAGHAPGVFLSLLLLQPGLCDGNKNASGLPVPNVCCKTTNKRRKRIESALPVVPAEFQQPFDNIVDGILEIRNTTIGSDSFERLKSKMETDNSVHGLRLVDVEFDGFVLFEKLVGIARITELHLKKFGWNEKFAEPIFELLKNGTRLKILELDSVIDCETLLTQALQQNTTLTSLRMNRCDIGHESCVAFANLLEHHNNSLVNLYLDDYDPEKNGCMALARALKFNTGLKTLLLGRVLPRRRLSATDSNEILNAFQEALKYNFSITEIRLHQLDMEIGKEQLQFFKKVPDNSNAEEPDALFYQFCYDGQWNKHRDSIVLDETELSTDKFARYIRSLKGKNIHNISLRACSIRETGCEVIVNELLPDNNTTCIKVVNLEDNEVGMYGCKLICCALCENRTLIDLNLNSNNIGGGDTGCEFLYNALINNTTLRKLHLQSNNIGDKEFVKLAPALGINKTLTILDLMSNNIGGVGCIELANKLAANEASKLSHLNLGRNNIGSQGCVALFNALVKNMSVINVNLESNEIGDDACEAISDALLSNQCLEHLNLESNHITDDGCSKICEGLDGNKDLQSLDLRSNEIGEEGYEELLLLADFQDSSLAIILLSGNSNISEESLSYFQEIMRGRE